jgi:hypothetical protein
MRTERIGQVSNCKYKSSFSMFLRKKYKSAIRALVYNSIIRDHKDAFGVLRPEDIKPGLGSLKRNSNSFQLRREA